ncbi:hypothetical protein EU508_12600 [Pseudoalteromonas fuliginea]|uniref:RiboL-PSP-HEPN domain-containing protein n=1 Tax=Pseudoalteromonas fuliginea TaxID=1872678 RepID=A0AB73BFH0_9GAMM|nr:hypothetical protein [Pseudoalteromonas fuliginea]KAA1159399.1 hypothetical protein EU508_12600 [Pseudoalteromonas fuliginea]
MSDYSDFCEMYGGSASDPDFMDNWLDEYVSLTPSSEEEWYQENEEKSHYDILLKHLSSIDTLLKIDVPSSAKFSLLVMLHGYIVSAIEGYLAGVFIHLVTNSDNLTRKLVESDPEFSKQKFTLKEIYEKQSTLKVTVSKYLKGLIFHDLKKIKPMYQTVLGHNFQDIAWLFEAVKIRHDCVHRAGYNKDGNRVLLTTGTILNLLGNVTDLSHEIEDTIKSHV